ncbi:unnamed protein product [Closterium sp. Naga37s-1]|nr:unnamed protein product [Closterium sp. Naga37s-1]
MLRNACPLCAGSLSFAIAVAARRVVQKCLVPGDSHEAAPRGRIRFFPLHQFATAFAKFAGRPAAAASGPPFPPAQPLPQTPVHCVCLGGRAAVPALRGKDYGKSRMKYADYTETDSGLQFKVGRGAARWGLVDWAGFTIGYYGRIFEARNKAKGGSFEGNEKDFFRYHVAQGEVIPAFEEAVASMKLGGVRRIVVPPEIGYPDYSFNKQGPKPTTFSGQRALDFVLKNQGLIDKTLLFDIELLKIIPS